MIWPTLEVLKDNNFRDSKVATLTSVNALKTSIAAAERQVQRDQSQVLQDSARLDQSQAQLSRDQLKLNTVQEQGRAQVNAQGQTIGTRINIAV